MEQIAAVQSSPRSLKPTKIPVALARAILQVQQEVSTLTKTERNEYAGYTYVGIDAFYEQVVPITARHGIFWTVRLENMRFLLGDKDSTSKEAVVQFDAIVDLKYIDGTVLPAYDTFFMLHPYAGPQTTGSAKSYASKAFMREEFKIATGEGDADSLPPPGYAVNRKRAERPPSRERNQPTTVTTPEGEANRAAALGAYRQRARKEAVSEPPPYDMDDMPYGRSLDDVLKEKPAAPAARQSTKQATHPAPEPEPEPEPALARDPVWDVPVSARTPEQHEAVFKKNIKDTPTIKDLVCYWEDEQHLLERLHQHNPARALRIKAMFSARRVELSQPSPATIAAMALSPPAAKAVVPQTRQKAPWPVVDGRGRPGRR